MCVLHKKKSVVKVATVEVHVVDLEAKMGIKHSGLKDATFLQSYQSQTSHINKSTKPKCANLLAAVVPD